SSRPALRSNRHGRLPTTCARSRSRGSGPARARPPAQRHTPARPPEGGLAQPSRSTLQRPKTPSAFSFYLFAETPVFNKNPFQRLWLYQFLQAAATVKEWTSTLPLPPLRRCG